MGISMKRRDGSLLRQAGFTLIEVMTVVAIVGVGSAIGIPSYLQWNERYQLRQVTSELRSNLLQARMAAKNRNITVAASIVKAADNTLTVGFGGALAPMTLPSVVAGGNLTVGGVATDFVASAPGILGAITFNQQGLRVAGGAGNQAVTLISPNGTTYTVTVTPSGKIN
jgi:prepilin-type N-terminal cleavage/methylation domain-containing protein